MSGRAERNALARRLPSKSANRASKLKIERDQWQHAAGQQLIRAERLEGLLETEQGKTRALEVARDVLLLERDALKSERDILKVEVDRLKGPATIGRVPEVGP